MQHTGAFDRQFPQVNCDRPPGVAEKTKNEPPIKVFQAEDGLRDDPA
ncbi:hypothetical protein [Piscinibacter sakaiensis]